MAALLVYAKSHVSRTDVSCQWTLKTSATDKKTTTVDDMYPHPQPSYSASSQLSETDVQEVQQQLRQLQPTGLQWLLSAEPRPEPLQRFVVADILRSQEYAQAVDKPGFLQQLLAVTDANVAEVEKATRGQRTNPLWSRVRAGRLTASHFGDVLKACRRNSFPPSLFATLLGEYDLSGVKAVQWGIEHEDEAVEEYVRCFDQQVADIGLLLHHSGVLAASPDRLLDGEFLLEVKCPFSFRESSIADVLADSKFCIGLGDDGAYCLKTDHVYFDQCQGQLHISGKNSMNFFVWLPGGSLRIDVQRDEEWGRKNIPLLTEFFYTRLIPAYMEKLQLV